MPAKKGLNAVRVPLFLPCRPSFSSKGHSRLTKKIQKVFIFLHWMKTRGVSLSVAHAVTRRRVPTQKKDRLKTVRCPHSSTGTCFSLLDVWNQVRRKGNEGKKGTPSCRLLVGSTFFFATFLRVVRRHDLKRSWGVAKM